MAITLTEAAKLTQDTLIRGVIEEIIKESPLMKRLPLVSMEGTAIVINREDPTNRGGMSWHVPNDTWVQSEGGVTQATFSLTILGEDCDVDNFIRKSMSNFNDQMAVQVKIKSKLMAHTFEEAMIYADGTDKQIKGLHALNASGQRLSMSANMDTTGAALTTYDLDRLIDQVPGGKPDILLLGRPILRRISQYLRTVGSYQSERDEYGDLWQVWQGVPLIPSDFITQTEAIAGGYYSAKTGGVTSSIWAIKFGQGDGLCLLQNGGITKETWDKLETKDASRVRLKWYLGTILYSTQSLAVLSGITDAAISA